MRILFFGSGSPASVTALDALVRCAELSAVVVPAHRLSATPLIASARRHGLKIREFHSAKQKKLAAKIGAPPDLICVATFPSILRRELLEVAPRGGINIHWSLLPKHRGPDPLFWTYLNDDRQTGVTVHWLDEHVDAGPILLQREIPLARGRPMLDVYRELTTIAGELLSSAVSLIRAGTAPHIEQDERIATHEPARNAGTWSLDVANWPAERVWHVLRGLTVGSAELLRDERGKPLPHGIARGYIERKHDRAPGTIERSRDGIRVFCRNGFVDVDPPPRLQGSRLRRFLTRWLPLQ